MSEHQERPQVVEPEAKRRRTEDGSYYKVIDGVKYDRELLELAQKYAEDDQVSYPEALQLWEAVKDGPGGGELITDTEKATLEYTLKTLKYSDKARNFMRTVLDAGKFTSYYVQIDGKKFDRKLHEKVKDFAKDGQISYQEAKELIEEAEDGKGITDIEKATLEHAVANFKFTAKAMKFMRGRLDAMNYESYYKIIDGQKYDRELLNAAERFAEDGQVGYPEAKALWELAQDGRGVTDIEKATLEYTLKTIKFSEKAKNFMRVNLDDGKYTSYYKVIDNVQYDREVLESAEKFATDGQISADDAEKIWELVLDGSKITDVEKNTVNYIMKNIACTDKAKDFLRFKLEGCA